ncbi:MAG: DinB family protein [Saprospiraceae bacterium]|nr:DinB family protein [Saprospiraceae bacterium]
MTNLDINYFANQLKNNRKVFKALLSKTTPEERIWKPEPDKWSLLEVVCHLFDEEREDFRKRMLHCLEQPENSFDPIDPQSWITEHDYLGQDFDLKLEAFLTERKTSVKWLKSLENPSMDKEHVHPHFGPMNARLFLENWVAHDYLHFRQITRLKRGYLAANAQEKLDYAGPW